MRIKKKAITITLVIFFILSHNLTTYADLKVGNVDLIDIKESALTYGLNAWHNNKASGNSLLPFEEKWQVEVGETFGQPVFIDGVVIVMAEDKLSVVEAESGRKLGEYVIGNVNKEASPFIIKNDLSGYNIICPTEEGVLNIKMHLSSSKQVAFSRQWTFLREDIKTNTVTILKDNNEMLNEKYVVFGTKSGKIIALSLDTGQKIVNGELQQEGSLGVELPYSDFSSVIIPANNITYERGYFVGIGILNGVLQYDYLHNDDMEFEIPVSGLSSVATYTKYRDIYTNEVRDIVFAAEKRGSIIAYDPFSSNLLFKVNKYDGMGDISGMAVSGNYVIVTYETGRIACIDYKKAIYDAQYHPSKKVSTITFEETLTSKTFSTSIVVEDSRGEDMLITADNEGFIKVYHMNKYNADTNRPIMIKEAFKKENKKIDYIKIDNGISSKLTYVGKHLVFVDGNGILHGLVGCEENNLSLANFENAPTDQLEKGKKYKASIDVLNLTDKTIDDVVIEFLINNDYKYEKKIQLLTDGARITFEYTIPEEYDKDEIDLEFRVNMKEKVIEENTYVDNVSILNMDVVGDVDLEVVKIDLKSYPMDIWAYGIVHVKNNTNKVLSDVPVKFTVNGNSKVEKMNLSPYMQTAKLFLFKTPNIETRFTLSGEINNTKIYKEIDYSNNKKSIIANIRNNVGLDNIDSEIIRSTGGDNLKVVDKGYRIEWEEKRVDKKGKEIIKDFWAELKADAKLTPKKLPSGNGFSVVVGSKVVTNYDRPNLISGAQFASVEFNGEVYKMLGGGVDKQQSFILPQNSDSVLYDDVTTRHLTRKIYLPVELKDGNYDLRILVKGAITPKGILDKQFKKTVEVEKAMYDNDYTKPKSKN